MPNVQMSTVQPNKYVLTGGGITITYLTSWFRDQPWLTYKDAHQNLNFSGNNEIRVIDTELGRIATVTISKTIDTMSTSFSVLLPQVNLSDMRSQEAFGAVGIRAVNKTELVLPATGARETYQTVTLEGQASVVEVPLSATGVAA